MAVDLSKLNFFNRLDARARVLVLLGAVIGIFVLFYLGTRWLSGGSNTTGPSRVANAPSNIQAVPGSTLTPEYQRSLMQANQQAAQQAQISGGSAVPTLINYGAPTATQSTGCVVCSDDMVNNVKNDLDDWARQGKISPETAQALEALADKNVPVSEYAAYLDQLVREGKLTPEQARQLLEKYKKQHENNLLKESAKSMDSFIKSGTLPLDVANDLLEKQKQKMTPAEYAAYLRELVRQGKISPELAQQLLAQYTQQRAKEIINQSIASLHRMSVNGEITKDVEADLTGLEQRMVPVAIYDKTLQDYISKGKMTPAAAKKILDEFKAQKEAIGPTGSITKMLQDAEAAAYNELRDLVKQKKITEETAGVIATAIQRNVTMDQFQTLINQLVQQNKLTPEIAKLKYADYKLIRGLRDEMQRLNDLQGNNATNSEYADELKKAVQAGILTPDQAKQLMQEYQAMTTRVSPTGTLVANNQATADFLKLQQAAQNAQAGEQVDNSQQFAAAQAEAETETAQDRKTRIDSMAMAMANQAQSLLVAWQPPVMEHKAGILESQALAELASPKKLEGGPGSGGLNGENSAPQTPPLIKAGTVIFAVLDTTANSDYPDSPVMATVVDGKFKGAKLLGKLVTTKGVSGQQDRVSLNFTLMDTDAWITTKSINAFAIDPDTARTVMASQVDYHYLQRFGAIMATSFLQGYASAITNAGTSTTGLGGTTSTHPELSPSNKLMVGLGQVGQTLGQVTQNYINIPPTVKVDAGVGLGILFMSDVTENSSSSGSVSGPSGGSGSASGGVLGGGGGGGGSGGGGSSAGGSSAAPGPKSGTTTVTSTTTSVSSAGGPPGGSGPPKT